MRIARFLTAALALGTTLLIAETASATSLDSCGDFFVDLTTGGELECTLEVSGGCETKCEPLAFEVSCAAGGQIECSGGEFDCGFSCEAGCSSDCDAYCATDGAGVEHCSASCRAQCSASCDAHCNIEFPDCETSCKAGCEGRCDAEINAGCNVDCSSDLYLECESAASGGCQTACESVDGALFCNGQWVNTDDVTSCADELIAYFDIEITGYAEADCEGNTCTAEAGCTTSCATGSTDNADFSFGLMMMGFAGAGVAAARRVRRPRR